MPNRQSARRRQKGRYKKDDEEEEKEEEEEEEEEENQLKHLRLHLFTFFTHWFFLTIPLSITLTCLCTYS